MSDSPSSSYAPTPIPSEERAGISIGVDALKRLLGQSVTDFCGRYGSVGDSFNHCAHFVSHVLALRVHGAALCSNVDGTSYSYEDRRKGFCIRVNQVFNGLPDRRHWTEAEKSGKHIIVATIAENILQTTPVTIGDHTRKHIGFFVDGTVYHYSNTRDQVVKQAVAQFSRHYGAGTKLLMASLP